MNNIEALQLAALVAKSSNCKDKQVGCVILNANSQLIASSYNYAPTKDPHTGECGIEKECSNYTCDCKGCQAIHAEMSALQHLVALKRLSGSQEFYEPVKLYCTLEPCARCQAAIERAGIKEVYFINKTSQRNRQCKPFKGVWEQVEMPSKLTLTDIGQMVKAYHDTLTWPIHTDEHKIENARNIGLALMVEAQEVLQAVPWKPWKPAGYKETDLENLVEELADLLFFTGSMLEIFGLPWSQLEEAFLKKLEENKRRKEAGETI